MKKYYTLVHAITGYNVGMWLNYEEAECYRESLDDWEMWTVDICA